MSRKFNALLGLGALAFASSAFAQCPSSPVPPWTAQATIGGGAVAITSGGYDGTSCKMTARINAPASGFATAAVRDDTPVSEPRYRAQFLVNTSELVSFGGFQAVQLFNANSNTEANGTAQLIRIALIAGPSINIIASCDNAGSGFICQSGAIPLAAGTNRIEFDLSVGASGTLSYWVNNTNSATPTGSVTLTGGNAAWVGVDLAFLGLAAATSSFRAQQVGNPIHFDEFDSRRQTFIGN